MPAHTTNKMLLSNQYLWMILHNYFIIRHFYSHGLEVENDIEKRTQNCKKNGMYICFSEHCHGNMCNLNVIVLLEFISKDLYTSLLKVAKFNFLPKHEAEIRP